MIFLAILAGLIIGSFLNVVIYRLPQILYPELTKPSCKVSLLLPRSHCPACHHTLPFWHNIPVLSFLLLKGRCAYCRHKISGQYPSIEILTAAAFVLLIFLYPEPLLFLPLWLFTSIAIPLIWIDARYQLLPDPLNYLLLWSGLVCSLFSSRVTPADAILGATLGYIAFWLVAQGFYWIRKKEGLGRGDCKLLAALGAWAGWETLPMIVFFACIIGAIWLLLAVLMRKAKLRETFAFGPALILSAWLVLACHLC